MQERRPFHNTLKYKQQTTNNKHKHLMQTNHNIKPTKCPFKKLCGSYFAKQNSGYKSTKTHFLYIYF